MIPCSRGCCCGALTTCWCTITSPPRRCRYFEGPPEQFFALTKEQQADLVWRELFVAHSPVSEACQGVLTVLHRFGLDAHVRDLPALRTWFEQWPLGDACQPRARTGQRRAEIYMTNSPFDDAERPVWKDGFLRDERFAAALRIDPLLVDWPGGAAAGVVGLRRGRGAVRARPPTRCAGSWPTGPGGMNARYLMVSLPPDFAFPAGTDTAQLLEQAVLPHCREFGLPLALMLGVRRAVNPRLQLAGDGVGRSHLERAVQPLRRVSGEPLRGDRAGPREPARAVRPRAQVPQPARLRLLVVHERAAC